MAFVADAGRLPGRARDQPSEGHGLGVIAECVVPEQRAIEQDEAAVAHDPAHHVPHSASISGSLSNKPPANRSG